MPPDADRARLVLVTHPEEGARAFARGVVDRGLAACANLVPVTSVYRWQGAVEEAGEVLLVLKTQVARLEALEAHLGEHHPYDVPELVSLRPDHVEPAYLTWLLSETGG